MIYVTNVDLVNDNEYTKYGLNLFILSQDIDQKPKSDRNQGSLPCWKFAKTTIYNTNKNLDNDDVHTKFGLNMFILSQDIEQKPILT